MSEAFDSQEWKKEDKATLIRDIYYRSYSGKVIKFYKQKFLNRI